MVSMIARLVVCFALLSGVAQAQEHAQLPLRDSAGDPMPNHVLSAEQVAMVAHLPGAVALGGPDADVTLYQFYDLNCPYCRAAAADVDILIRNDPGLRLVLVPY